MAFFAPPSKLQNGQILSPAPFVTSEGTEVRMEDAPEVVAQRRATLVIPIDSELPAERLKRASAAREALKRRDSMKRREALLKGKEGSRRRQRWENDHLLSNPHAAPPDPQDWAPHPLYPQKTVRYEVAQLWDHPTFRKTVVKPNERLREAKKSASHIDGVPKLLKERIKKSGKGAVEILKGLEEEVRSFMVGGTMKEEAEKDGFVLVDRDREVEIEEKETGRRILQKPVLETEESDPAATFGRWLVHSIAKYYGLHSWSVTVGESPAKRIAYVGMIEGQKLNQKKSRRASKGEATVEADCVMPKPLWLML